MSANRKIYIVGLTGGIASGKSEAARYLESLGAHIVDADEVSRALTAQDGPALPDLRACFGDEIFFEDGQLNRAALAAIVFNDPEKRRMLDALMHPAIQKAVCDEIEKAEENGETLIYMNVPLLFETGMDALCDETWLVTVDADTQLERLMNRDEMTEQHARARIASQMPQDEKIERANVTIDNNRSLEKMYSELQSLYQSLVKRLSKD